MHTCCRGPNGTNLISLKHFGDYLLTWPLNVSDNYSWNGMTMASDNNQQSDISKFIPFLLGWEGVD